MAQSNHMSMHWAPQAKKQKMIKNGDNEGNKEKYFPIFGLPMYYYSHNKIAVMASYCCILHLYSQSKMVDFVLIESSSTRTKFPKGKKSESKNICDKKTTWKRKGSWGNSKLSKFRNYKI